MTKNSNTKPIRGKAYGSIGHLSGSRLGPSDSTVHAGQERILTVKIRDYHDRVIVTEKLDGSCVGVANIDGTIVAVGRAGLLAAASPHVHIRQFAHWVERNAVRFWGLENGQRMMGEWCTMAHGTRYRPMFNPFVPFDLMIGSKRLPFDEMKYVANRAGLRTTQVLHDDVEAVCVSAILDRLGNHGHHGAVDPAEGAVWRVERKGEFDFIAKFVRDTHVPGRYMPGMRGNGITEPVWFDDRYVEAA
jgi:hypothetical protein